VLIRRWRYVPEQVQVGDVVCFKSPTHPHRQLIKRVIAVHHAGPVRVQSYTQREDTERLLHVLAQGALDSTSDTSDSTPLGDTSLTRDHLARWTEVPAGHVWLEGDNHRSSIDSNHYGPVRPN
jgi:inner membrane protease subunit 2